MLYGLGENGKAYKFLHATGWTTMKPQPKPRLQDELFDYEEGPR